MLRLPRTAKRGADSWLKLVTGINRQAIGAFRFEGKFLRPGTRLARSELPELPVLLECAGGIGPPTKREGWGHKCLGTIYILWRLEGSEWIEAARTQPFATEWMADLLPVAERLLSLVKPRICLGSAAVAARVIEVLDSGLEGLSRAEREECLTLLHDQLASRLAG
jgi:hypothetical protein